MTLTDVYRKMARSRGDDYRPRTRHFDEEGRAVYTNRLFLETSPYLLQHAHNPVDWFPWGDEAFDRAAALDRPVLLSIGYATCHWCHVMEEESFEDEEIARFLNAHYVAVKVDREERPDVDAIYMGAVQALTGRGGWPMTVWMTPDRRPFYGGTYFPARDGERGTPIGFLTLLRKIHQSYIEQRDLIARSADQLTSAVRRMVTPDAGNRLPAEALPDQAVAMCRTRFDSQNGGFAGAPKFPSSLPIRLLLRHHRRTGDPQSLHMAALSLEKMAAGGIHDQVGGGFHRYSTDDHWRVPHFEKMLYDNALLVFAYLEGWQASGNPRFRQVAAGILDYAGREMTDPEGPFYAATDADSRTPSGDLEEGIFFTWTMDELVGVLGPDDARTAAFVYGATPDGNFEGRNVLFLPRELEPAAAALDLSADRLAADMVRINTALYGHRCRRPAPLRDEKVLASWNGLMISAFARAGFALDESAYVDAAARAASFIYDHMIVDGRLKRSFKDGVAHGNGFLDDYAFTIAAMLDLFTATTDPQWLDRAVDLQRTLDDRYADSKAGGYFMTAEDHEVMIAREKPIADGAIPSGNAVAVMNLLRLNALLLEPIYRTRAEAALRAFSAVMEANPAACGELLIAFNAVVDPPRQVIVLMPSGADHAGMSLRLRSLFRADDLVMMVNEADVGELAYHSPLFQEMHAMDGKATAYVCRDGAWLPPFTDSTALIDQLVG